MTVDCPHCGRVLIYSGDRPAFCGYCGRALEDTRSDETVVHERSDETIIVPSTGRTTAAAGDPDHVAGYRLLRTLGRGGMGTVYEAEESGFGRRVAVKLIAPEFVSSREAVERFRQEGRLASTIEHPRCVFVLAADEDEGRPFIVMELMPGANLQGLVEQRGPLPIEEAIAYILDVVDGLREAHRLGVIHRDVKPSNCFLEADGRVKVGDFGLSKSLEHDSRLTRTGSFLGTPLYASPEQIKRDPIDVRTDVYSTAATLFYLLTGQAPFKHDDATATMARIVSDPAPSARQYRPEVPPALDRIVLRGLDRDPERRWQTMDELREALRPFVPGRVSGAGLGQRIGAYFIDFSLLTVLEVVLDQLLPTSSEWLMLENSVPAIAYFLAMEGYWGASVGKRLARLRVADQAGNVPPRLSRVALRSLIFCAVLILPTNLYQIVWDPSQKPIGSAIALGTGVGMVVALLASGCLILLSTIGLGEGGKALHDVLSGTRVVSLPRSERRRQPSLRRRIGRERGVVARPVGVLQAVGPYRIRGAIRMEPTRKVLVAEDSALGREVWVVLRPRSSPPPPAARRDLKRATRSRWLSGGDQSEGRWDAFVAPSGCPLADLAGPEGLPWREARPILQDLADELAASCGDGTLPEGLGIDQVWVQPDGHAQLLDPLGTIPAEGSAGLANPETDQKCALELMLRAAAVALEGGRRRADDAATPIRAAVPLHACRMLDRLMGRPRPYGVIDELRADLTATRDRPTEIALAHRALHLGTLGVLLLLGLLFTFAPTYIELADLVIDAAFPRQASLGPESRRNLAIRAACIVPALWVAWSFVTRGGLSLSMLGLAVVRRDGKQASRWRCGWRALVMWAPLAALLVAAVWTKHAVPRPYWLPWVIYGSAIALLVSYLPAALLMPSRGLHDRLAGTCLVPK